MSLGLNWDCRSVSVGKEFIEWGYGDNGLIVLSQKAPSFPLIRLDINPVDWLNFNYFHPWLFSDVIATVNIYFISTNRPSFSFIEKYLSSHAINLKLYPGLNLALGESIIYSDKFEILYLILITFFKAADHYLSNLDNGAGGNTQFFASLSSKENIKNTHLYGTLFIDEITVN